MNKKIKGISLAIVVVAVICGIAALSQKVNASSQKRATSEELYYSQKSVYDTKDDGWINAFEILYFKDKNIYIFDGYNLKYKELDGYYVPIVDEETGEVLDKVKPDYITLSISEVHKKDIKKIGEFFNKKQFNKNINIKDLEELDIETISKEYLVDLFNRTISSELQTKPGDYHSSSFINRVNVDSTDKEIPGEWQVSYILNYGNIYDVNIEFIDVNGKYLSDVAKSKSATTKQIELFSQVEKLEKSIISNQKMTVDISKDSSINSSSNLSTDLAKLFDKAETDGLNKKPFENK